MKPMFEHVLGHQRPLAYLQKLLETGNLPNCFLFHGPQGVGKQLVATEVARYLNCQGTKHTTCECAPCKKILATSHLDVFVYEPDEGSDTFKIDKVREIIAEADRKRFEGSYRVFILNDAHCLNDKAADALLKTVEEGRDNLLFILLSTSKAAVIPTLVSRSLEFYFAPLQPQEVRSILSHKYEDTPYLEVAASLGEGSVTLAEFFLTTEGIAIRDTALKALSSYPRIKDFQVIDMVNDSPNLPALVDVFYMLLADVFLIKLGAPGVVVNSDKISEISALSARFGAKTFNALSLLRVLRERRHESVAFEHHVKSTLLQMKKELK